jgi:hypothetical protein
LKWLYKAVLPAVGLLLLTGLACLLLPCRKSAVATIGPWKTGLSGQLQKAFVTGTTLFAQFHTCAVQCADVLDNILHFLYFLPKMEKDKAPNCSVDP